MTNPASTALGFPQAITRIGADDVHKALAQPDIRGPATRQIRQSQPTNVEDAIANAARSTTVDFNYLVAQAQVESAMNPTARASTSSATGLYQFIESTWLDTMKRHGERFGMGELAAQIGTTRNGDAYVADPAARAAILDLRNDPQVASLMAAGLAEDNRAHLMPILGRQPDSSELYLAHFLGAGGAGRFLSAMQDNPSQSAASLFRRPAAANRAVFYQPNGVPRSLQGVMDHLGAKMDRAMARAAVVPGGSTMAYNALPTGTSPAYPARSANPVPYLITAEEVFEPRTPPQLTGSPAALVPQPQITPNATLRLPGTPQAAAPAAPAAPASHSMSNLLGATYEASGASQLASPESAERIERAYQRLRALGL
ncbi:MAG: transglycosylase SLT domain-containing protein [Pseudomonadota bacterium]